MTKKKLKVDMEQLVYALDSSGEEDYYLDLETGEVLPFWDREDMEDAIGEPVDDPEENPERYAYVDNILPGDAYDIMVDFARTVEDEHLLELLSVALNGRGAFGRFRDVLYGYPEQRQRWYEFKQERMMELAQEFLDRIGIEPV